MQDYLLGLISLFFILAVAKVLIKTGSLWSDRQSEYKKQLDSIKRRKHELGIEYDIENKNERHTPSPPDISLKIVAAYAAVITGSVVVTLIIMKTLGYRVF